MTELDGTVPSRDAPGGPVRETLAVPPRRGRYVYLRPIMAGDYANLQTVEMGDELGPRWRLRGATPSPEVWSQSLWQASLVQFLIVRRRDDVTLGMVGAYRANFQHRHAYLAATYFAGTGRSPLVMIGIGMFVRYVFACWDFHKLYMEVPEYNYPQFASGAGKVFEVEGRLRDHSFHGNRRWDEYLLAIYRDRWQARDRERAQRRRHPIDEMGRTVTIHLPPLPERP
jgi:hypothetical protein